MHSYFVIFCLKLETDHWDVPFVTLMDVLTHPEVPYLIRKPTISHYICGQASLQPSS